MLGNGAVQIVAGWRNPNAGKKVGIRLYFGLSGNAPPRVYTVSDNTMACEDLKIADLNGDGKSDIIACGRATKNVAIYWNRTQS